MIYSRPHQRFIAALLASVALATAGARPLLACDAVRATEQGARAAAHHDVNAPSAAHAHHATLDEASAPQEVHDAPHPRAPHAPACDHVVGCAVMAIATAPGRLIVPARAAVAPTQSLVSRIDAPVRAIDPPPPRSLV